MQYVVQVRCVVTKFVTCEKCTEDQARNNPWEHSVGETEADTIDWEVKSVKEIK